MKKLISCLALLIFVSLAARAEAQSPAKCDSATVLVSNRRLPAAFARDWNAWHLVASCAGGVSSFVSALTSPQITTESDAARLSSLFEVFDGRLDETLFAAYTDAVANRGGSDAFRIAAMRALAGMVEPAIEIRLPRVESAQQSCGTASRMYGRDRTSSTLPTDAFERVIAAVSDVATSGAAPRVKLAAACWQALLEDELPDDVHKISIAYVCGNKFRVANHNPNGVDLKYVVGNHLDSGEFGVRGRWQYELVVSETGTVSVYLGGTLVGSQANGGAVCK